ncbi:cytochrome P450 [Streptomyces olivaceiscleroticus]|uniref:Uncharacterized protein n=1 Tax=Streptomyces olivaceiscleroticus TaxID=68245 RepID=A0ABN0ZL18_9ACTN
MTIPRGPRPLIHIGRHQRVGHPEPAAFLPERWEQRSRAEGGCVGFGRGRRKCPAERFSRTAVVVAVIVQELLSSFAVHAPIRHTQALEGGGLHCPVSLGSPELPGMGAKKILVHARDRAERLAFGAAQVICLPLTARAVRRSSSDTARTARDDFPYRPSFRRHGKQQLRPRSPVPGSSRPGNTGK